MIPIVLLLYNYFLYTNKQNFAGTLKLKDHMVVRWYQLYIVYT